MLKVNAGNESCLGLFNLALYKNTWHHTRKPLSQSQLYNQGSFFKSQLQDRSGWEDNSVVYDFKSGQNFYHLKNLN